MRLIDADALQYSDARDMLPTGQYITREEIDKAAEPPKRTTKRTKEPRKEPKNRQKNHMRLIDADELLNKTANLEAVALEQVSKYEPSENPREWHRWTGILQERTAFKYDLMDAPTIEAEPRVAARWIECLTSDHWKCSKCGDRAPIYWDGENRSYAEWLAPYCPNCGAKMNEEEQA